MNWSARMQSWLRGMTRRASVEQEMNAEIRFHIESYAQDLVRSGVAPDEAMRRARLEFGAVEAKKEECRASLGLRMWDELRGDLRYSLRLLRKSPGFAAVIIATLALGIGANTAIFTLVDAIVLRFMPVQHAEQLYQVNRLSPGDGDPSPVFTNPLWESFRDRQDVFSSAAAWGDTEFNLARGGEERNADGTWVNGDYFATLGVRPALGRLISAADDRRGCPAIAVLSYNFWQQHYGGSATAVGSTLSLNSQLFEIVGVAAPGFYGMEVGRKFDVAAPICATALMDGAKPRLEHRSWWWLTVVGRIKDGISPQQLQARLRELSPQVMESTIPPKWDAAAQTKYREALLMAKPAGSGISWSVRQQFQQPLFVLMVLVGVVLLIACANIASLLLARAAQQQREIAVRLALGATRMRLVRQLLAHCVFLSLAGAVAGALLARWGTTLLVTALSTSRTKVFLELTPDWRVLAFTVAVAVLTGILFGVLPALKARKVPLTAAMRGDAAVHSDHRSGLRKAIVASQVAMSLILLVTAGLFLRSFDKLLSLNPGFDKKNVLLVTADLKPTAIKPEQQAPLLDQIQERIASIPGVTSISRSHITPLSHMVWNDVVASDVPNAPKGNDALSMMNFATPGFFATMRMPLLAGRDFTEGDSKTAPQVVVINEKFAKRFFPGIANPIGHFIHVDEISGTPGPPIQVVGIVADAKYSTLRGDMQPTAFFPLAQVPETVSEITFEIRTSLRPESIEHAVEAAAAGVNRQIPLQFNTLEQQLDDNMVQERLLAILSAFFGAVALLLAMIGLYGTVSYQVTLRKSEFGIRMALGARVASIVRLVLREVAIILAIGVAAGVIVSLAATSALGKLLFGLGPRDVTTIAGAAALLSIVAVAAAAVPARRAARVDPMIALRCE
jgi:putative ABC transport system permease protein